jgi:hypothetical protein
VHDGIAAFGPAADHADVAHVVAVDQIEPDDLVTGSFQHGGNDHPHPTLLSSDQQTHG